MDFWRLFGYAKKSFYSHPVPVELPIKNEKQSTKSFFEFCKSITPECRLNPLLFNGHLQTFWTTQKEYDVPIYYKRHVFEAEDARYVGTFAVDFVVQPYDEIDVSLPSRTTHYTDKEFDHIGSLDDTPMLVALHGLSGGSHEIYLRQLMWPIFKAGWQACVVNSRGCAESKITSGVMYNARSTWDVRQTVKWLRKTFPNRPLLGIGFSLGANIFVNYLGEEGEDCELKAVVVVSNPWNLEISSHVLRQTWLGLNGYLDAMGTSMRTLFEKHVEAISKNPRVNIERVRKIRYLFEFDRELQGPTWGYPTEGAYYRDASCCDSLLAIAVSEALPYEEFAKTPFAVLCTTSLGGHLGWFEKGGDRWFVKPASQFLFRMTQDIDLDKIKESTLNGSVIDKNDSAFFNPMRRKLEVPSEA
ncbi:hypothetical protein MMC21_004773 [Puttea exsequens]|nr:hypothetical protein [Puttea exsequens]